MLNNEQITYIRQVLKNRGVETLDLLDEMTDHFTLAVEQRWEQEPHLALRYALTKEIAAFGPHGMQKLQREYELKLEKSGRKMFIKEFLELWKLPQIVASVSLFALIYFSVLQYQHTPEIIWSALSTLFFIAAFYHLYFSWKTNKLKLSQFQQIKRGAILPISLGGIFMVNFPDEMNEVNNIWLYVILSGSYCLFLIVSLKMIAKGLQLYKTKSATYVTA